MLRTRSRSLGSLVVVVRMSSDKVLAAVVVVVAQVVNLLLTSSSSSSSVEKQSSLPTCPSPSVVFCPSTPCTCVVESSSPLLSAAAGPYLVFTLLLFLLTTFASGVHLGLSWRSSLASSPSQPSVVRTPARLKALVDDEKKPPASGSTSEEDSAAAPRVVAGGAAVAAQAQAQIALLLSRRRSPP
jgi:hypothetical protein